MIVNNLLLETASTRCPILLEEYKKINDLYISESVDGRGATSLLESIAMNKSKIYNRAISRINNMTIYGIGAMLKSIVNNPAYDKVDGLKADCAFILESICGNEMGAISPYNNFKDKYGVLKEVVENHKSIDNNINNNQLWIALMERCEATSIYNAVLTDNPFDGMKNDPVAIEVLESFGYGNSVRIFNRLSPVHVNEDGNRQILLRNRIYEISDKGVNQLTKATKVDENFLAVCGIFETYYKIEKNSISINEDVEFNPMNSSLSVGGIEELVESYDTLLIHMDINKVNHMKVLAEAKISPVSKCIVKGDTIADIIKVNENNFVIEFNDGSKMENITAAMNAEELKKYISTEYSIMEAEEMEDEEIAIEDEEIATGEYDSLIDEIDGELNEITENITHLNGLDKTNSGVGSRLIELRERAVDLKRDKSRLIIERKSIIYNRGSKYRNISEKLNVVGDSNSMVGPLGKIKVVLEMGGISADIQYDDFMVGDTEHYDNSVSLDDAIEILIATMEEEGIDPISVCDAYVDKCYLCDEITAMEEVAHELDVPVEYVKKCIDDMDIEEGMGDDIIAKAKMADSRLDAILSSRVVECKSGVHKGKKMDIHRFDEAAGLLHCIDGGVSKYINIDDV